MSLRKVEAETYPLVERRSGIDRRQTKCSPASKFFWQGQRGTPRRQEDREKVYRIDRHEAKTVWTVLGVLSLSLVDAILTLYLIYRGAAEVNPVMNFFLQKGPMVFFVAKYLLTCLPVLFILSTQNAYLFKTRLRSHHLILLFVVPFALVVVWEVYLILWVMP